MKIEPDMMVSTWFEAKEANRINKDKVIRQLIGDILWWNDYRLLCEPNRLIVKDIDLAVKDFGSLIFKQNRWEFSSNGVLIAQSLDWKQCVSESCNMLKNGLKV